MSKAPAWVCPVGADEAGAVHREAHRQALDRHIVHDLVEGALQEGRVDHRERFHAVGGESRGERHGVLFGKPDIESAVRKCLLEGIDTGPGRHRRGDGNDLVVLFRLGDQAVGEHPGEGGNIGLWLVLDTGDDLEFGNAVIPVGGFFGRAVTLALRGHHVDQDGPLRLIVADVTQDRQQMVEIVAVHRADIEEAELFEQRSAGHQPAGVFLGPLHPALDGAREPFGDVMSHVAQIAIALGRNQPRQVSAHRAHRRRDGHVVVVEDHDQPAVQRAGVIEPLIGHPAGQRAVPDYRDDPVLPALEIAADRETQPGRHRSRRVRGAERVVFALRPFGEAGQAAALANRTDAIAPAGEDLVRVALVPDVPDQDVLGRVEQVMDRDRELDHAEPGAEMPAGGGNGIDHFRPQLVGHRPQFAGRHVA